MNKNKKLFIFMFWIGGYIIEHASELLDEERCAITATGLNIFAEWTITIEEDLN